MSLPGGGILMRRPQGTCGVCVLPLGLVDSEAGSPQCEAGSPQYEPERPTFYLYSREPFHLSAQ